jgi:hypothetical protein
MVGVFLCASPTWPQYKAGVTIPAPGIFRSIEISAAARYWLLTGAGESISSLTYHK